MAKDFKLSNAAASAAANAVCAQVNSGYIEVRSGTKPATADTAATGTLLAKLNFSAEAFASAVNGVANANAITQEGKILASGTATWFRAYNTDNSAIYDGTVATSNADMIVDDASFVTGGNASIPSHVYTQPK
ncbi:hypothetical protein [Kiloniella sp.]|uniref:hypothetical protein n=1 Tax=Kiloniella sp. TaxID=1938587 RepID=UPI003B010E98